MTLLLLERENARLREALSKSEQRVADLEQRAQVLAETLRSVARDNKLLEEALKEALRKRRGPGLDAPGQLRLIFGEEEPLPPTPPHAKEAPDGETPQDRVRQRHRPKRPARELDFQALPREHVVHELPPTERRCPTTKLPLVEVGETTFEELDYQPARLRVVVHHRKVYGLSEKDALERKSEPRTAPLPPRPIERSPASAGLLAWMLVQKYRHHLPLYRQQEIFAREGLQIPRQTQCEWVMACAHLLAPIQAALRRRVLASGVVQIDDTPVVCQDKKSGGNVEARLWVATSPLVAGVVYDFTMGRAFEDLLGIVGRLEGVLVGDGFSVHHKLARESGGKLVTAGCWAHVLRKVRDGLKEAPAEGAALAVTVRGLFHVERQADEREMDFEQRLALRRAACPAILAQVAPHMRELRAMISEAGKMHEALTYLDNQWESLVRFLQDGRIPIHNNACERAIRPVAVGRRNWLFAGSERGGKAAATIYTLIESCRRANVDPFAYLADVLVRVNTHRASRVEDLLPERWKLLFGTTSAT